MWFRPKLPANIPHDIMKVLTPEQVIQLLIGMNLVRTKPEYSLRQDLWSPYYKVLVIGSPQYELSRKLWWFSKKSLPSWKDPLWHASLAYALEVIRNVALES